MDDGSVRSGVSAASRGSNHTGNSGSNDGSSQRTDQDGNDKEEKRRIGVNVADNLELMLLYQKSKRKWATPVLPPLDPIPGARLRKTYMPQEDYDHLFKEVTGPTFGPPARPEIELHTVGVGSKIWEKWKKKDAEILVTAKEETQGNGIEILFDYSKCMYILSELVEDKLILLLKTDRSKASIINSVYARVGKLEHHLSNTFNIVTMEKQRIWRRFIREHLDPASKDKERLTLVEKRYVEEQLEKERLKMEADREGVLLDAAELSSDTDSWTASSEEEEEEEEVDKKKKKKGKVLGKKDGKAKGGGKGKEGRGIMGGGGGGGGEVAATGKEKKKKGKKENKSNMSKKGSSLALKVDDEEEGGGEELKNDNESKMEAKDEKRSTTPSKKKK